MNKKIGKIKKAKPDDLSEIQQLLTTVNLPIEGVKENLDNFLIYKMNGIKGCIGLEIYSKYALLRSAAVHPDYQNQGIGKELTNKIIEYAQNMGIEKLFLITNTAENFFKRKMFVVIQDNEIPVVVKQSVEFTFQCALTGKTMMLDLR